MSKNVYVVLGMARSGTSAITRGFKALGIELGDHLIARTDDWNPKGVWEDSDIVYKINRNASFILDYAWMEGRFDQLEQQYPALNELKMNAVTLLNQRLASLRNWGFKDPRMVKLLPFWDAVFQQAQVCDQYVMVLRNPLAVAHSNLTFSKIDLEVSIIEWLQTMIAIVEGTRSKQRVLVAYESMLDDPRKQLERIHAGLNSLDPINQQELTAYSNQFLDRNLHHHVYTIKDLVAHPAAHIAPLAAQAYTLLMRVAYDEFSLDSEEFNKEWLPIKQAYARQYPVYQYIDTLHKRNKQLAREIRTIQQSVPWKLSYPLRLVDDTLRGRRLKKRALRKIGS